MGPRHVSIIVFRRIHLMGLCKLYLTGCAFLVWNRTFNLKQIQSIQAVNYDWGKYDKVPSQSERRIIEEQKKREAEERLRNSE